MGDAPRFVVDAMLGRLARWLRLLGWDVVFDPFADDPEIAALAAREDRIVLTRDRGLLARKLVRRGLYVDSEELGAQLRQVLAACGLEAAPERMFTRCVACNTPVEDVSAESVRGRVPPFVLAHHDRFRRCPGCARIFWGGTHGALARRRLEELLEEGRDFP